VQTARNATVVHAKYAVVRRNTSMDHSPFRVGLRGKTGRDHQTAQD
jgi:hypothetical protein